MRHAPAGPRDLVTALTAIALVLSVTASAQWPIDPTARQPVCTADGWQGNPILMAVDGSFVVLWRDVRRLTSVDVYAQRFTAGGEMLWSTDGRVVAEGPAGALLGHLQEVGDATQALDGTAFVTWNDTWATGTELPFMTKIHADGSVAWGDPGVSLQGFDSAVPLADERGWLVSPHKYGKGWNIAVDSEGGAFVPIGLWGIRNFWVTRLGPDGSRRTEWFSDPDHSPTSNSLRLITGVEPGGDDSVMVVWVHGLGPGEMNVVARKLVDPEVAWPVQPDVLGSLWGPVPLDEPGGWVCGFDAVPDGFGGAVSAWTDTRTGNYRVYAQRIASDGAVRWTAGGVDLGSDTVPGTGCMWYQSVAVAPDGEGGAVVVWNLDDHKKVAAQRIDADGSLRWGPDGVTVFADLSGNPYAAVEALEVVGTTDGQFVVLAGVTITGFEGLIVQKYDGDGLPQWGQGRAVYLGCTDTYGDSIPTSMVSDGEGGVVIAFAACDQQLYAHRVGANYLLEEGFDLGDLGLWTGTGPID